MVDLVETSPGSDVYIGSGNVLVDIGLPDAEELHAKIGMIVTISRILEERGLTKKDAAKLLKTTQKIITRIQRYKVDEFPIEQLIQFASALEYQVIIELRPRVQSQDESSGVDVHAA